MRVWLQMDLSGHPLWEAALPNVGLPLQGSPHPVTGPCGGGKAPILLPQFGTPLKGCPSSRVPLGWAEASIVTARQMTFSLCPIRFSHCLPLSCCSRGELPQPANPALESAWGKADLLQAAHPSPPPGPQVQLSGTGEKGPLCPHLL